MTLPPTWSAKVAQAQAEAERGHLRKSASTLMELAGDLALAAEQADGLLSTNDYKATQSAEQVFTPGPAGDMTSCTRGAHTWGPLDSRGWVECAVCGTVNTNPKT